MPWIVTLVVKILQSILLFWRHFKSVTIFDLAHTRRTKLVYV